MRKSLADPDKHSASGERVNTKPSEKETGGRGWQWNRRRPSFWFTVVLLRRMPAFRRLNRSLAFRRRRSADPPKHQTGASRHRFGMEPALSAPLRTVWDSPPRHLALSFLALSSLPPALEYQGGGGTHPLAISSSSTPSLLRTLPPPPPSSPPAVSPEPQRAPTTPPVDHLRANARHRRRLWTTLTPTRATDARLAVAPNARSRPRRLPSAYCSHGQSKGCAMVRFETRGVCDVCIGALHQKIHVGGFPRPLNVQYAKGEAGAPRPPPGPPPGFLGWSGAQLSRRPAPKQPLGTPNAGVPLTKPIPGVPPTTFRRLAEASHRCFAKSIWDGARAFGPSSHSVGLSSSLLFSRTKAPGSPRVRYGAFRDEGCLCGRSCIGTLHQKKSTWGTSQGFNVQCAKGEPARRGRRQGRRLAFSDGAERNCHVAPRRSNCRGRRVGRPIAESLPGRRVRRPIAGSRPGRRVGRPIANSWPGRRVGNRS